MSNDQLRETKKITTPSGREVEIKTYLTARERNAIRAVFFAGMKIDPTKTDASDQPALTEISGELFDKSRDKLIEIMVVSVDGATDGAYNKILDGSPEDYDFIAQEADLASKGNLTATK